VGVLLSAFGTFWVGEGIGVKWPGEDGAILGLIAGFFAIAWIAIWLCRRPRASASRTAPKPDEPRGESR
jgi:Ca2+/H+ antiporter, TMEM165/GDT1 family